MMNKFFRSLNISTLIALLCLFMPAFSAPSSAVEIGRFTREPPVRIGVRQKANRVNLEFRGDFRIIKAGGVVEIYSGSKEKIRVELYNVHLRQLPGIYRVSLGKFRSFEQAEFTASGLEDVRPAPVIVQPDQWSLWFGPFSTKQEAEGFSASLARRGFLNTRVEANSQDIKVVTVYSGDGELLHLGNEPVLFYPADHRFLLDDREYRGRADIVLDSYGTFSVVNVVDAEDYLYSVLPREMPPASHEESLKSQAVIARTYLLNNLRRHLADGFNLCSTPDCQVYGGVSSEHDSTTKAVDETRGVVLAHGDELANALFHSTCGGRTASYSDAWSGKGPSYLVSVDDGSKLPNTRLESSAKLRAFLDTGEGFCKKSRYFRWTRTYSHSELYDILKETVPEFSNNPDLVLGALKDVKVTKYSDSGRALELLITTSDSEYRFEKDTIRWVMGNLKSTMFLIEKKGSGKSAKYELRGAGWGHGVGLCQIGAMKMGGDGYSFRQILLHYYPETRIVDLWE